MDAEITPMSREVGEYIAANLRQQDRQEITALFGDNIPSVLDLTWKRTPNPQVAWIAGEPVCMFGVCKVDTLSGKGNPWMVGTPKVEDHPVVFLRKSRELRDEMLDSYRELTNFVDARNTYSLSWLKWLGFAIEPALPLGRRGEMFHRFWMRSERQCA